MTIIATTSTRRQGDRSGGARPSSGWSCSGLAAPAPCRRRRGRAAATSPRIIGRRRRSRRALWPGGSGTTMTVSAATRIRSAVIGELGDDKGAACRSRSAARPEGRRVGHDHVGGRTASIMRARAAHRAAAMAPLTSFGRSMLVLLLDLLLVHRSASRAIARQKTSARRSPVANAAAGRVKDRSARPDSACAGCDHAAISSSFGTG